MIMTEYLNLLSRQWRTGEIESLDFAEEKDLHGEEDLFQDYWVSSRLTGPTGPTTYALSLAGGRGVWLRKEN